MRSISKVLSIVLIAVFCNMAIAQQKPVIKTFYYLSVQTDTEIKASILMNGFPILEEKLSSSFMPNFLCNLYLVNGKNNISIVNHSNSKAELTLKLETYPKGSVVNGGDAIAVELFDENDEPSKKYTFTLPASESSPKKDIYFMYDEPGFESRFNGPELSKEEVLTFAIELLEIFRQKDTKRFYKVFKTKIFDYMLANGVDPYINDPKTEYWEEITATVKNELATYPDLNEIILVEAGTPSVIELKCKPNNPFCVFNFDENGKPKAYMKVFVAKINGEFQVIR